MWRDEADILDGSLGSHINIVRKISGKRIVLNFNKKEDVHTHKYTEKTENSYNLISLPLCRGKLKSGTGIGP